MVRYKKYSSLLLPDKWQVMGLKLRPFCLGHYVLMERFGCSLVNADVAKDGLKDFVLALTICSRTYEEFLVLADDNVASMQWALEWGMDIKQQLDEIKSFDLKKRTEYFRQYMDDSIIIPHVEILEEGKESGADWTHTIITELSERFPANYDYMNLPLARVIYDFYKILEKNGNVRFLPEYMAIMEEQSRCQ